jgi:hypothetical protein
MEIWEPKLSGTLWATPGVLQDSFISYLFIIITITISLLLNFHHSLPCCCFYFEAQCLTMPKITKHSTHVGMILNWVPFCFHHDTNSESTICCLTEKWRPSAGPPLLGRAGNASLCTMLYTEARPCEEDNNSGFYCKETKLIL